MQKGGTIYLTNSDTQATKSQAIDYGFIVEIVPTMVGPETITVDVTVSISGIESENPLKLNKYKLDAKYSVNPEEIILVNKMTKISDQASLQQVPYICEIPVIGGLFTNNKSSDENSNLMLLMKITPLHTGLVKESGETAEKLFEKAKQRPVKMELTEEAEEVMMKQ